MIFNNKIFKSAAIIFSLVAIFASCNKDVEQFEDPYTSPVLSGRSGFADTLASASRANNSLYSAIITKAGLAAFLNDKSKTYTMFVPTNAAVKQALNALTGGAIPLQAPDAAFLGFIQSTLPADNAKAIVSYNTVPGIVDFATMSSAFPNFQYPSIFNPAPEISPLVRLSVFPSRINGNYVNNIPVISQKIEAGNGIFYETAALVAPPTKMLWERIASDPGLTYLKAAIQKADSGTVATDPLTNLVAGLSSIGANLTVFAPTDNAFKSTLTGLIYQKLAAMSTPAATAMAQATALASTTGVFTNPMFAGTLTAKNMKGIIAYHMFGNRAFTNNFPAAPTFYKTLLNSSAEAKDHPGVELKATFTGPMVSAATIKGMVNTSASNIAINPTPDPAGTSDQHYVNGVLHKIDHVLLPVPIN